MRVFQIVPEPGQEVCDFCASAPQWKVYSCRNFVVPWTKRPAFAHESSTLPLSLSHVPSG